jgi:hypothetical protein
VLVYRKVENKRLVNTKASNIDVDALWAQMNSPDGISTPTPPTQPSSDQKDIQTEEPIQPAPTSTSTRETFEEETITIHRTIRFAGRTTTETKVVPITSAEAKLFLSQQPSNAPLKSRPPPTSPTLKTRRPLYRISAFDPNPPSKYPRAFSSAKNLTTINTTTKITELKKEEGNKINVVEKSKIDWAGYVDKEGLQEELVKGGRSKEGYLGRREFLDKVDERKEKELREVRRAGRQ